MSNALHISTTEAEEDIHLILRNFDLAQSVQVSFGLHTSRMNDLIAGYRHLQRDDAFVRCKGSDDLGEGSAWRCRPTGVMAAASWASC
ncbi:MAG: hypothetical protein VKI81_08485 [Synechococcaceae cyanobacterium]|nr:hypothetical protein [Synechococcaceae cyanobacterium]